MREISILQNFINRFSPNLVSFFVLFIISAYIHCVAMFFMTQQYQITYIVLLCFSLFIISAYKCFYLFFVADRSLNDKAGRSVIHHAVMGGSIHLVHYLREIYDFSLDVSVCMHRCLSVNRYVVISAAKVWLESDSVNSCKL